MPDFTDVWVDIGAKNKEEAEELVRCGDPVTFALGLPAAAQRAGGQPRRWTTRSGCGCAWRRCGCCTAGRCRRAVYGVSTVAEEIGLRGATTAAYAINPTVGIAVDVCHATDTPGNDKKQVGEIEVRGGAGAVPRAEHQPARVRPAGSDREGPRDPGAGPRRAARDGHGRQRHPDQPRGRGDAG